MSNLYTCDEIAERYKVDIGTVWKWIRERKLLALKMGRNYRIREEDLQAFEKSRMTVKEE